MLGDKGQHRERLKMKAPIGISQQRRHWASEETDWVQIMVRHPFREEDVITALMEMVRQPAAQ